MIARSISKAAQLRNSLNFFLQLAKRRVTFSLPCIKYSIKDTLIYTLILTKQIILSIFDSSFNKKVVGIPGISVIYRGVGVGC